MLISCFRIVRRIVLEKIEAQPSGKYVIHSLGSTQLRRGEGAVELKQDSSTFHLVVACLILNCFYYFTSLLS